MYNNCYWIKGPICESASRLFLWDLTDVNLADEDTIWWCQWGNPCSLAMWERAPARSNKCWAHFMRRRDVVGLLQKPITMYCIKKKLIIGKLVENRKEEKETRFSLVETSTQVKTTPFSNMDCEKYISSRWDLIIWKQECYSYSIFIRSFVGCFFSHCLVP